MNKYHLLAALAVSTILIGPAQAEPASNVVWDVATHTLVKRADANIGAKIEAMDTENAGACTDCHGTAGAEPDRTKTPTLAGQVATYTFKQLRDFKDGKRKHRIMEEAVERLSDEQLATLAAWYAQQPLPKVEVDEDEAVSKETLALVFRGDKTRLIQPCAACHGSNGEGAIVDVPAIAGQNVKYFVNTLKDYAKGKRGNDVYAKMRIIAKALTRDEINELAVYYARLGGQPPRGNLIEALIDGSAFTGG